MEDFFDRARKFGIKIHNPQYKRSCELETLLSDLISARHKAEQAEENTAAIDMLIGKVRDELEELWRND